ncbi:MAG TPA: hypothetical protein VL172_14545 [Kofleriaceae bacterium]|nr:hypothetical protein [Kofleriaceae bacterium]
MSPEQPEEDEPVPRIPRGRGWGFSGGEIVRIGMFGTLLVAVLVLRKPCSENVSKFMQTFEPPLDASPAPAAPATHFSAPSLPDGQYVHCSVDESPAACVERLEKARNQAAPPADAAAPAPAPKQPR